MGVVVGLVYTLLAVLLALLLYSRRRNWSRWFSDQEKERCTPPNCATRIWAAPFVTAGWLVLGSSIAVTGAEIALFIIILHINGQKNTQE